MRWSRERGGEMGGRRERVERVSEEREWERERSGKFSLLWFGMSAPYDIGVPACLPICRTDI